MAGTLRAAPVSIELNTAPLTTPQALQLRSPDVSKMRAYTIRPTLVRQQSMPIQVVEVAEFVTGQIQRHERSWS
jgi:hypothetical protein